MVFWKVLFVWQNIPIFSFTGYTLTEFFRKPDNWQQIYKQMGSIFYTSNVPKTCWEGKIIRTSQQGDFFEPKFNLLKNAEAATGGVLLKIC